MPAPVPPTYNVDGFDCPYCYAFAGQTWFTLYYSPVTTARLTQWKASFCARCKSFAIWLDDVLVYPLTSTAPPANPDLPADVGTDYAEAASVLPYSPRASAALLRLAIEKLCKFLGEKGALNDAIGALVKRGLSITVQQALDVVRVTGNYAVHPGEIDLRDDRETARSLFALVNLIADAMISEPKRVAAMFEALPEGQRTAIEKRDAS